MTDEANTESRQFELKLDVKNFTPEEINVKKEGREVSISAQRQEKYEQGRTSISRSESFSHKYFLPDFVDVDALTTDITDGVLTVKAPYKEQEMIKGLERAERGSIHEAQ
ncbi:protein lethal(2)essential for life-like [Parasteatoda tepidariorum]|uniref:protein lethal(2)essential for life-like n=1 Tax=Parasteatoda tepidariorum TaxID=114398 RepID=UPI00077FE3D4|nr:protein lethal(2)essential for life-like [Parasteatoda tepidariorum]